MATRKLTRAALGAAVLAACFGAAFAAEPLGIPAQTGSIQVVGSDSSSRFVQLGVGVKLSGSVASAAESAQATDVAAKLVGSADKVVNNLTIRGRDQVMLKVTVAEVQRDVIKQLGIDLNGSLSYGSAVINFNNSTPFTALGQPLVEGNGIAGSFKTVSATLRAME